MRVARRPAVAAALAVVLATSWAGRGPGRAARPRPALSASRPAPSASPTASSSSSTTAAEPSATQPPPATAPPATGPPAAGLPSSGPTDSAASLPAVAGPGIAIGDSVLEDVQLYAPATLESHGVAINAAVGRQWAAGMSILAGLKAEAKMPPVVVVALGSNGQITSTMFDQMMQLLAGASRVVFMTVTGPLIGNNPVIRAGVARYPNAVLADWNALAAQHPDWFAPDDVHVGPAGAAALGGLLASLV